MLAARTDKQKDSQDAYMEKLQDIKVRVPKEYYDKIKLCAEKMMSLLWWKGLPLQMLRIAMMVSAVM